jgi:ATP-dependent helicase/nuclease subunit A
MSDLPWARFTPEQRRAAFLVDRHVVASAGAGSGKTTVMAVRYVACLLADLTPPDRILALAFTVEAAGNLRARIDRTLRAVLRAGLFPKPHVDLDEDLALSAAERGHLRRCLAVLPGAPITTVDGACLAWVREGAAQLGRDPDRGPAEAVAWAELRVRAWRRLQREAAPELVALVARHGESQVRHALLAKMDQVGALPSGQAIAASDDAYAELLLRREPQLAALPAALQEAGLPRLPDPWTQRGAFCDLLRELDGKRATGKTKEQVQAVQDLLDFPVCRRDGKRPGPEQRRRRGSLLTFTQWDPALDADLAVASQHLVQLIDRLRHHLAEESASAGVSGFNAISAEALALLRDPATARRLATRYRHVLLDEAQDLNRLQAQLVESMLLPDGPRVFTVGDHRQSIFGFRHAAPEVFAGWEQTLPDAGGTIAVLRENFRSHPGLVLGIKDFFASPEFRPADIEPGRDTEGDAVLAAWQVVAPDDMDDPQAEYVAERIATSPLPPEAHAILLRSRTRMATYARALERRGVACDTDFPEGLIDSQEVADVEAVLRLALCPHDRDALAVAVGGPWGTADTQDKTALVEALSGPPEAALDHPDFATLVAVVARTRAQVAAEGPAAAVRALAMDARLTARYGELPLARRRLANLLSLAEEEQHAGRTLDLVDFCQRLRDRRAHGVDEAEASGAALGGRGVRLMTIHGSKGLEWPVVWLPELDRAHGSMDQRQAVLGLPRGDALQVAVKPGPHDEGVSLVAELLADDLRVRQVAEEKRLFYVACTRARDELHLVVEKVPTPPDERGLTSAPGGWVTIPWQPAPLDGTACTRRPAEAVAPRQVAVAVAEIPAAELLPVVSVTDVVADVHGRTAPVAGQATEEWLRRLIGTTVHAAFATFGVGMSEIQARNCLADLEPLIPAERFAGLVAALTDSALIPGYWEGERLVEQPLIGERDGQVITAQPDLLLKRADGWHLYDFKTGMASSSESSVAQVRLYAELVRPLLDAPLVSGWLVDVERRRCVPVPLD